MNSVQIHRQFYINFGGGIFGMFYEKMQWDTKWEKGSNFIHFFRFTISSTDSWRI